MANNCAKSIFKVGFTYYKSMMSCTIIITADDINSMLGKSFSTGAKLWAPDGKHWSGKLYRELDPNIDKRKLHVFQGLSITSDWGRKIKTVTNTDVRNWNYFFVDHSDAPILPKTIFEILSKKLPTPISIGIEFSYNRILITIIINIGQRPWALCRRILKPKKKSSFHKASIKEEYKNQTIEGTAQKIDDLYLSPILMRNFVNLYDLMGINVVSLNAGWSSGSATWPKFGFAPTSTIKWVYLKYMIKNRHNSMNNPEKTETKRAVSNTLSSNDTISIFRVSDLKFINFPKLNKSKMKQSYKHDLNGFLLQDFRWAGILNLDLDVCRKRMEAYIESKGFRI